MRPSRFVYVIALSLTLLSAASRAAAQTPTITGTTPERASPGEKVTITGTNFSATSAVKFGSVSATVVQPVAGAGTSVDVIVPDVSAGSVDLVVASAGGASSAPRSFAVTVPMMPITVTPKVIQPANGKLPASMTLVVFESNCDDKTGTDLSQGTSAPYSLAITGSGLTLSSQSPSKCAITAVLTIDPNAAGPYKIILYDKAKNQVGLADIGVLDSSAGPIPPGLNPDVDVMWEVMSQNNCSDAFGKRVAQSLYCVQLKIGNNSGHPIQIAGIGFTNKLKALAAIGIPQVTIANSSYASTRAVLLQSQVWSNRNLIANSLQGAGLIMAGFTPFFSGTRHTDPKLHYTTLTTIVSGAALQAYNLIVPDPIVPQIKSLDDQSFRDNMVIPNNSHTPTVVFVEKQAVTTALRELHIELKDAAASVQRQAERAKARADAADLQRLQVTAATMNEIAASSQETIKNSTRPGWRPWRFKGNPNPLLVKLALGNVVIVGDEIEYLQRVQIQSAAAPSQASPLTASPSSLSFSSGQNGVTNGAAQSITLTNSGSTPLTTLALQLPGTSDFSQTNTCASTLAAGDKCTVSVTYTPSTSPAAVSPRTATLQVASSAGSTPLAINLTGTAADTVYFSTIALSLGTATTTKASKATLTITNFKSSPLTGLTFNIPGTTEFTNPPADNTCSGGPLNTSSSCTVTITFTPTAATPVGTRTATMAVTYQIGGAAQSPPTISLSGTAQ